jgi:hypothetical protein
MSCAGLHAGIEVSGVMQSVRLMCLKAIKGREETLAGDGARSTTSAALQYAIDNGADSINNS